MRAGVDIGGTKTDAVAIDDAGAILHQLRVSTGFGEASVLETTGTVVASLASALRVPVEAFESVGVGVPGAVDSATGRVSHAVNLGVDELELGTRLAGILGVPVRVENDVNAAALGAFHLLELPPEASMAYLNLGTGLAAGLVLDGRLWRGARGTAGEIGHIPASAVRILVLSVDVQTVVIGGGISSLGDPLLVGIRGALDGWSHASQFLASLRLSERVRLVPPGTPVSAVGAAFVGATSHTGHTTKGTG